MGIEFIPDDSLNTAVGRKVFSLDEANRSLPLVRRIVEDIVAAHRELHSLRDQMADAMDRRAVDHDIEHETRRMETLQNELEVVGCELKDPSIGLIDFLGQHQGREIYLCWKLGEDQVQYWHELHSGFASRRPVSQLD